MPRGDRTGPEGSGPMTGRGRGYCNGNYEPGFAGKSGYGRGFFRGRGRGRGFGPGFGGAGFPDHGYIGFRGNPSDTGFTELSKDEKISSLQNRISWYENAVKELSSRIDSLQKEDSE